MRAGELRQRVSIERERATTGDWGRETAWSEIDRAWASVTAKTGAERSDAKTSGTDSATQYDVRLRYRDDVRTTDRLVLRDGRVLDIVAVLDPDGRGRELTIDAVDNGERRDG